MKGSGAVYEDKEVVVDGNLVTSRHHPIAGIMREMLKMLRKKK